ncbi:MAG: family 43 glycosylhydrolase [Fibrobacteria bacterium]|nr:family 43 glycosylhydrolase [Fibrobacteria bacterium]
MHLFLATLLAFEPFAQNVQFAPSIPFRQSDTQPGAHDPTVVRDDRGVFTLLSTNNLLSVWQSSDMATWSPQGKLLKSVPSWMLSAYPGIEDIWAPHVSRMGGRYWVYYCGSVFGKNTSLIGALSTPTLDVGSPAYQWTDAGEVWRSRSGDDYNAIDPEILVEPSGKAWMSMGSFWQGLRMISIDPATGKQSSDKTLYKIASRGGGAIEGPSTIQHGPWTYLFAPFDKCCSGVNSTYRTMYGRSSKANGPFLDESGKDMAAGGGTQILSSYGRYVGPGGGSPFHDGRRDWFAHHYYDRNRNGAAHLQIREIVYGDDGWLDLGQPFLGRHQALEAEHAVLVGDSLMSSNASKASNSEYVGYINGANSSVEFLTTMFQPGRRWIVVRYAAGDGDATHRLSVNGAAPRTIAYPKTPAWGDFPAGQVVVVEVEVKSGRNSFKFSKGDGFAELDRIDVVRPAADSLRLGAFDRSPNASWDPAHDAVVLGPSSKAVYENMGFDEGGFRSLELCAISGTGRARVGLGQETALSMELDVPGAGCHQTDLPTGFQNATGIHDLFLANLDGTFTLGSIRFRKTPVDVERRISIHRPDAPTFDALGRASESRSRAPRAIPLSPGLPPR